MPSPDNRSRHEDGATLLELMLAATVTLFLMAATMSVVVSSRSLYTSDQTRTAMTQDLRAGMDLLSIDLLQAGARLPEDIQVIFVTDGGAGPDTLVLRQNMVSVVLPLCEDLVSGTTADEVKVARNSGTIPAGCDPLPDDDGDGVPDNIGTWRDHRIAQGGTTLAYIYDPVAQVGEFFPFDNEDAALFYLRRSDSGAWLQDYSTGDQPRIYLLEQKSFRVNGGGVLEYFVNGDPTNNISLIPDIADFQVRAIFAGTPQDTMDATDDWTDLDAIEITLVGQTAYRGRTLSRSLTSEFFPRNVLSR